MALVIVGLHPPTINDFNENDVILIEGISERIDYIRSKKFNFKLIPRFVTDKYDSGKQITIHIKKTDVLTTLRRKKLKDFNLYQSMPFYDSRPILVTTQKLKDIFPIKKLIINYQNTTDIIGVLLSAENKLHDISTILIKNNESNIDYELIRSFLKNHVFSEIEQSNYITFENKKPTFNSKIIRKIQEFYDMLLSNDSQRTLSSVGSLDNADKGTLSSSGFLDKVDILALNPNDTNTYIPFNKYFPCQENTLYHSGNTEHERLKNLIIFGSLKTMTKFFLKMKEKKIVLLENLKNEGFLLVSFNKK